MFSRYASKSIWALLAAAWLASCAPVFTPRADAGRLPSPVTNNAVAYVPGGANGGTLYSFLGLGAGKTHADIVRSAFACGERSLTCRQVPDVPVDEGRLASSAATVAGKVYIFGGYTVAADGAERSTPEVFRFDPVTERYERTADMPTPVDDATAIDVSAASLIKEPSPAELVLFDHCGATLAEAAPAKTNAKPKTASKSKPSKKKGKAK